MKKTFFYLLLVLFCLYACRTEDSDQAISKPEISSSEAMLKQKNIDKDLKLIVYNSYRHYLINNGINKFGNDIDFGLSSQVLQYENGQRALVFPLIKDHTVNGLVLATLSKDEKFVRFSQLNPVGNEAIKKAFETQYNKIRFLVPENSNVNATKNTSSSGYLYSGDSRCHSDSGVNSMKKIECDIEKLTIHVSIDGSGPITTFPSISPMPEVTIPVIPYPSGVGGVSSLALSPTDINALTAKDPVKDFNQFFKCLDKSKPAKLTVYAERGIVGDAFISITQGSNVLTFGFYPKIDFVQKKLLDPGTLNNDSQHLYNTSLNVGNISPAQLTQIMNLAYQYQNS